MDLQKFHKMNINAELTEKLSKELNNFTLIIIHNLN